MDCSASSDTVPGDLKVMALADEELHSDEAGDLNAPAAGAVVCRVAPADGLDPLVCDESSLQKRRFLSTLDPCNKAKDSLIAPSRPLLRRWSPLSEDSRAGPKDKFSSNNKVMACSLTCDLPNRSTPYRG